MALQSALGTGADNYLTETGVTAAGTTQATATHLKAEVTDVSTVTSGTGVRLCIDITPSERQTVFNSGANVLKVYPPVGFSINNLPANQAITLGLNTGVMFTCVSSTKLLGVLSA